MHAVSKIQISQSALLFHARARGRRVGQLEPPAGKTGKNDAGAAVVELNAQKVAARPGAPPLTLLQLFAHLLGRRQFCGPFPCFSRWRF